MIKTLKNSEIAILKLRALYESRGYAHFKMSKFEEYDIYAENKDFLSGESVITFTDLNGRLMALKPDVTMSIIKNSADGDGLTEKLYYNENVYRASGDTRQLKELMQSGLECIGDIDIYNTCEVIGLAAKSLSLFKRSYVLDISHMGIVSGIIDPLPLSDTAKKAIIKCIGEKNSHEVKNILNENGIDENNCCIGEIIKLNPAPEKAIDALKNMPLPESAAPSLSELETVVNTLKECGLSENIRLDFSVVQDMSYYNGIVFQGFIDGVPEKVLSGGRYDLLMRRIGKAKNAVGFGVNVDLLESILGAPDEFDADIALLYNDGDDPAELIKLADKLSADGSRVAVIKKISEKLKYRKVIKFNAGGAEKV